MRHGCWLGALLIVALVAAVVLAFRPERRAAPEPPPSVPEASGGNGTQEPAPASALAQSDDAHPDASAVDPDSTVVVPAVVETSGTRVSCRVIEATDRKPVADAVVALKSPKLANAIVFDCDENGAFDVELAELSAAFGDAVGVVVRDGDGHVRLRASSTLEPDVTLLIPASLALSGEVVLPGLLSPEGLNVSVWTSQANEGERFIGNQMLEEDGRFLVRASPVLVPGSFVVRVDRGGIPTSVRVPTEDLTSPAGARVEVALTRLAVTVLDDVDAPIARANVRVFREASPQTVTTRFGDATTGEDGIAHVWLPAGPVGVMAGAPRHTAESEYVVLAPGEGAVTIRSRRLSTDDVLHGRVELDDGTPAPGAHVVAWYARDDGALASASMVQQPADVEGAFDIAIATDRELVVTATDKVLGGADRLRWQPGSGPVRLVIQRGGTAIVQGEGLRAHEAAAGEIDVVIVGPKGRVESVGTDVLPITFSHLEPGSWRIFSVAEGLGAWAVGVVRVESGKTSAVTLAFQAVGEVTGVVGRARGLSVPDDATVEFAPPGWPDVVVERLLRRALSANGGFRIPAPLQAGELRVRIAGNVVERRPARVGTPLDIVLPD